MTRDEGPDPRCVAAAPAAAALACALLLLVLAGCGTSHPAPIAERELAEAQTFPYYKLYWVGPSFEGERLAAADGLRGYIEHVGDSVYYGDCVKSKGIFGGGSCELPLQVTTVIYRLHYNGPLGPQSNILDPRRPRRRLRRRPLDRGLLGPGRDRHLLRHATRTRSAAAEKLLPLTRRAPRAASCRCRSSARDSAGAVSASVAKVMETLPNHVCRHDAIQKAFAKRLSS